MEKILLIPIVACLGLCSCNSPEKKKENPNPEVAVEAQVTAHPKKLVDSVGHKPIYIEVAEGPQESQLAFDVRGENCGKSIPVIKNGRHGLLQEDKKVRWLKKPYRFATYISEMSGETFFSGNGEDLISVQDNKNKYGFINDKGELIIDCIYDNAERFSNGLALVKKNQRYGYINTSDSLIIPFNYTEACTFSDGLARVTVKRKFGFIDRKGALVIPAIYNQAFTFTDGLCCVSFNKSYGDYFYIDSTGNTAIKGPFEKAWPFEKGKAFVVRNGQCLEINRTGKVLRKATEGECGGC